MYKGVEKSSSNVLYVVFKLYEIINAFSFFALGLAQIYCTVSKVGRVPLSSAGKRKIICLSRYSTCTRI